MGGNRIGKKSLADNPREPHRGLCINLYPTSSQTLLPPHPDTAFTAYNFTLKQIHLCYNALLCYRSPLCYRFVFAAISGRYDPLSSFFPQVIQSVPIKCPSTRGGSLH